MDLNSPLFDRIRMRAQEASQPADVPTCNHPGCRGAGSYRAPKGRGREGQYWRFCLDHVRAYNHSYNYFAGMTDEAVAQYQKADVVGHRPTWTMGVNAAARGRADGSDGQASPVNDPFSLFGQGFAHAKPKEAPKPRVSPTALKALETLGLDEGVDAATIKARYKTLVKQFHPDANGGDRSYETRLQEIIRAYNTLKSIGLC
jgi:hypothetical protein